jgi:hypothetical protein
LPEFRRRSIKSIQFLGQTGRSFCHSVEILE